MVAITATESGFGAHVEGVDIASVPDAVTHALLLAALDKHRLLIFRNGPAIATDASATPPNASPSGNMKANHRAALISDLN